MSARALPRIFAAAALALAAPACSAAEPSPQPEGRIVTSLSEIAGPWDIVRLGDYAPVRLHGGLRRAFVHVGDKGLSYTLECNYSGNPARIDAAGVLHDESEQPGSRLTTLMLCPPEQMKREGQLYGFFGTRPKVRWAEGGRVIMDNGTTALLLERPETRRLANAPSPSELEGRWVPVMAHRVDRAGGHSGWGFGERAGVVTIEGGTLRWTACPGYVLRFRYTADFRLVPLGEGSATCDAGRIDAGVAGEAPARLARVLSASPAAERTAEGGIALFTDDGEVVSLRRESDLAEELRAMRNPPRLSPSPAEPPPPPAPPPPSVAR